MNLYYIKPWLLGLHLLGVILWVGGTIAASLVSKNDALRILKRMANPGMLLAYAFGLSMLIPSFREVYARAGWMHTKLLLLLVMSAFTGIMQARLKKDKNVGALGAATTATALVILLLATVRP